MLRSQDGFKSISIFNFSNLLLLSISLWMSLCLSFDVSLSHSFPLSCLSLTLSLCLFMCLSFSPIHLPLHPIPHWPAIVHSHSVLSLKTDGRTDGQTPPSLLNHSLLALHSIFQPLSPPKQHTPHDCNTKKWKLNALLFNAIERSLVQLSHTRTSVCEGIMSCHQLSLSILCSNSKAQ